MSSQSVATCVMMMIHLYLFGDILGVMFLMSSKYVESVTFSIQVVGAMYHEV